MVRVPRKKRKVGIQKPTKEKVKLKFFFSEKRDLDNSQISRKRSALSSEEEI